MKLKNTPRTIWIIAVMTTAMIVVAGIGAALATDRFVEEDSAFGPDTITLDTVTGFRWLDLTVTEPFTYNEVVAELEPGGIFEGYRLGLDVEVEEIMNAFDVVGNIPAQAACDALMGFFGITTYQDQWPEIFGYVSPLDGTLAPVFGLDFLYLDSDPVYFGQTGGLLHNTGINFYGFGTWILTTGTIPQGDCLTAPDQPFLISPEDGATDVSLAPTLHASDYDDPGECSTHFKTRWQISDQADFSGLTYNANTFGDALTSHEVTKMVLEPGTTYYWRVKYWGDHGLSSDWSDVSTFTTAADTRDQDDNGVPDDQDACSGADINGNDIPDCQENDLRSLLTPDGNAIIGLDFSDEGIVSIAAEAFSADAVAGLAGTPGNCPYGMIGFRVAVASPGATVSFTVHLEEAAPADAYWYKYDTVKGWYDFTDQVTFSGDRKSLTFTLTDGGLDDADGLVNGIIVDPAGMVEDTASSSSHSANTSCFITSCSP